MALGSRALFVGTALLGALACSGRLEAPGNSMRSVADAGSFTAGSGNAKAGAGGLAGNSASGGTDSGGAPDELPMAGAPGMASADAQLMPTAGNAVSGTVHFVQNGEQVDMTVSLTGCPEGPHALHLHANAACGDNGNAAGGHWLPEGDGIGDVMCGADGTAWYQLSPAPGSWSLGGPAKSDVLRHALVLHQGPNLPEPGGRIACGISAKVE